MVARLSTWRSGDLARISFNGLTSMKTPIRILFRVLINLLLTCLLSFQVDEGLPEIGLYPSPGYRLENSLAQLLLVHNILFSRNPAN